MRYEVQTQAVRCRTSAGDFSVKTRPFTKNRATRDTRGCFIGSVDVDFKRLRTPLVPEDQLIPQQLLALSTIDRALLDSGLPKGGRVAVIVGLGTEMELYRHRARVTLRERFGNEVSPEKRKRAMAYVNRVGTSTSYVSYIGNLVATRVSSRGESSFTVTEGGNSVFRAPT